MLVLRFNKSYKDRTEIFNNMVENIVSNMKNDLGFTNVQIISDNDVVEISAGSSDAIEEVGIEEKMSVELMVSSNMFINNESIDDRFELDKLMSGIKHFVSQAKNVKDFSYLPINKRK